MGLNRKGTKFYRTGGFFTSKAKAQGFARYVSKMQGDKHGIKTYRNKKTGKKRYGVGEWV